MSNDFPSSEAGPTQESTAFGHRTVTEGAITTFGALTGDYAQMHFDRDFGPATGMGGTIAHGLLSAAWSIGALTQHAPERIGLGDPGAFIAGYQVRFARMTFIGDLFSLRWKPAAAPATDGLPSEGERLDTAFEVVNQRGEVATDGAISVCVADGRSIGPPTPPAPEPFEIAPWSKHEVTEPIPPEAFLERGPRGETLGRTVTETDLVNYTNFTGELNPAYLNQEFARSTRFGARIAPPMWTFCVGFGEYLRDLLSIAMPSRGFAGHLGDQWRFLAPVYVGDTLRTRHKPVSYRPSSSRPDHGIVEFGIQIENQRHEIVQDGRIAMMMGSGAP